MSSKRILVWMVAVGVVGFRPSGEEPSSLLEQGKSLYLAHCSRCHGIHGDAAGYYGIIPLAGLGRRPPDGLIGRFRSERFIARGEEFSGTKAKALWAWLVSLRGEKGYVDPGWVWSPRLLDRKKGALEGCRIVDVRPAAAYAAGHIPNAVSLSQTIPDLTENHGEGDCLPSSLYQRLAIGPLTQVVVYDAAGGPAAAWVWWQLLKSGHPYVAVLDGGWERWVAEGHETTQLLPRLPAVSYQPAVAAIPDVAANPFQDVRWDWRQAVGSSGLRNAAELGKVLEELGIPLRGCLRLEEASPQEGAFLVLVLRLLGREAILKIDEAPLVCSP